MSPMMFSKGVPKAPHYVPYPLPKVSPQSFLLLTYINQPKGKHSLLIYRDCYIGEPPKFQFCFWGGDGPIK